LLMVTGNQLIAGPAPLIRDARTLRITSPPPAENENVRILSCYWHAFTV
jgi:hypothetical protein